MPEFSFLCITIIGINKGNWKRIDSREFRDLRNPDVIPLFHVEVGCQNKTHYILTDCETIWYRRKYDRLDNNIYTCKWPEFLTEAGWVEIKSKISDYARKLES